MSSKSLPRLVAETAVASPQVVAHRLMRMATAGSQPSARDQAEFYRMGSEKVAAFYESWMAMGWQALRVQQQMMFSMMFPLGGMKLNLPTSKALEKATTDIIKSGLKPVHKRAVANAKRLGNSK